MNKTSANDNTPRHADDFGNDLAARRDWLASLPQTKAKPNTGNRIERSLVAEQSPLVTTLRQVREIMRPADLATTIDMEGDSEEGGETNTGFGAEMKHNQGSFLPSIPALLEAYADGMRTRVVSKGGKIVGRVCTSYYRDRNGESVTIGGKLPSANGRMRFHGLRFYCGELVAYGHKGRMCQPKYTGTKVGLAYGRGSATELHVNQTEASNASYLELAGTSPLRGAPANDNANRAPAPPFRTENAAAARMALAGVSNDNVPVTKLSDGIAAGYGRLGGISESAGPGATTAPRHAALDEMDRAETFASINIDHADIDIIEAILANESFRAIGLRLGFAESSAHRTGRKAVERALETISKKIAA